MELQSLKNRFDLIGDDPKFLRALAVAEQVAATDMSVLVMGESGVGKESIPQIIHSSSPRKHHKYIAVNCGAIPEGTMESELAISKALLPVPTRTGKDILRSPTGERYSWTRLENLARSLRRGFSGFWKAENSTR